MTTLTITPEYRKRIVEAILETENILNKQLLKPKSERDLNDIDFYNSHILKLNSYLISDTISL
jgi:hypothetical protein